MPIPPPFREDLIERYDRSGPRYTSYPPATEFDGRIDESNYREWARLSNEELIPRSLSLYFHIPFCSSICYYCGCNKIITKRREKAEPYLQDLYREIEIQGRLFDRDREVRQLHWGGGTPGFLTRRQSSELMAKIDRHFRLDRADSGEYAIEIDPREMQNGDIRHLRGLGFNRISIGVQDFDPRVQQAVNRVQSEAETAAVIDEARLCGMRSINIDLIYGLPHQSVESFVATLDRVIELDADRIAMYNYAHLPQRFPPQRRIREEDLPVPGEKLDIMRAAIERLCEAGYLYIGMDHFARPRDDLAEAQRQGKLLRNFQGYSAIACCDSIGFGVSAISHVADHYSQNTTSLEQYHEYLAQNRLPVVRGYHSSEEDLLRSAIIQDLVCHFRVDRRKISHDWGIDFSRHFADELERLEAMQEDGLIRIDEAEIRVLEAGRLLVRNICMVFDRFQRLRGSGNNFSRTL
ncbi:MAG TPA: oxygen-independent coproporphyrinogen III oxidase [Gammaproteobacteria bacterium]|nr:oxygen-independent coproporphyrinogen III oxidase [Gammaproteobacteria bacterium]